MFLAPKRFIRIVVYSDSFTCQFVFCLFVKFGLLSRGYITTWYRIHICVIVYPKVQTVDTISDTITGFESKIALSYVAGFVLISTLSVIPLLHVERLISLVFSRLFPLMAW